MPSNGTTGPFRQQPAPVRLWARSDAGFAGCEPQSDQVCIRGVRELGRAQPLLLPTGYLWVHGIGCTFASGMHRPARANSGFLALWGKERGICTHLSEMRGCVFQEMKKKRIDRGICYSIKFYGCYFWRENKNMKTKKSYKHEQRRAEEYSHFKLPFKRKGLFMWSIWVMLHKWEGFITNKPLPPIQAS